MLKESLLILVGLLNLGVGVTVLGRNYRKLMNLAFFLVAVGTSAWIFGIAAFFASNSVSLSYDWARLYYIAPFSIFLPTLAFAQVFPSGGRVNKGQFGVFLLIAVAFSALLIAHPHYLLRRLVYHSWGKEFIPNNYMYAAYAVYLLVIVLVSIVIIVRKIKRERGLYRLQARTFFSGYIASVIMGLIFNLLLPVIGNYRLIWVGPLGSTIYVVAVAYTIIRHRLFNIRLIIARSLGYGLAITVLSAAYGFLVLGAARFIFHLQLTIVAQVFLSVATGLAAFSFQPLRARFNRATERIFYRDAYDPQALFDQLNKVLVSTLDLDTMLSESAKVIDRELKPTFCIIGVKDGGEASYKIAGTAERVFSPEDIAAARKLTPNMRTSVIAADNLSDEYVHLRTVLTKNDIALLVRLAQHPTQQEEGIGYLVLGAKKSGNPYGRQDIMILETIANELVIAIQNALHFEEIQDFNLTLQERVNKATGQLRRTNTRLRELDSTKDDFISMASHQLRTPLTSVKGYLSMVLEGDAGELNDNQRKLLEQSYRSSQQMVYLISDLLNLSRLNTGKFVIEPSEVDLRKVAQFEVDQLAETAKARGVTLVYDSPATFPSLQLDETKTHQVVMNFIDNAIYYTPAGGTVTVSLKETPHYVEYRVADTGIGVPRDAQRKLFTKFYRAENAQKARPDGTGLGLFMAKKVVTAQGGSIIFESEEGKGSTFGFRFNKARVTAAAQPHTKPELAQAKA